MDSTQVVRDSIGDRPRVGPSKRRTRLGPLMKVDKRSVAGKRIAELRRLFASELTGAGAEITPMRQLKIDAAAQAVALAETARSRFLREGKGDVADLVAVQRNADAAVRRIGLPPDKPAARLDGGQAAQATQAAPARVPTIAEVTAEQAAPRCRACHRGRRARVVVGAGSERLERRRARSPQGPIAGGRGQCRLISTACWTASTGGPPLGSPP